MWKKIKSALEVIVAVVLAIIIFTVTFSWVFTFLNITYGVAIWSNQWLLSLF